MISDLMLVLKYENLLKAGVIDPAKSKPCSFRKRIICSSMLLTTDCVLAEKRRRCSSYAMNPGMGGMGGMM